MKNNTYAVHVKSYADLLKILRVERARIPGVVERSMNSNLSAIRYMSNQAGYNHVVALLHSYCSVGVHVQEHGFTRTYWYTVR